MLLEKVKNTIIKNEMLKYGDKVICAVSGGADSICLLHVMRRLQSEIGIEVYVANVNHMIRGETSERDSRFVRAVCQASDTKCFYREIDVPREAVIRKLGSEECGRILRYEFFDELSKTLGGAKIATGHNLNDNAETVLFRMIRGSGAKGISGIKYKRGRIIRPLLDVTRTEIESYLKSNSLEWVTDESNLEPVYARNKIRLNVLPSLCSVVPAASENIVRTAAHIAEDDAYLSDCATELFKKSICGNQADIRMLCEAPKPIAKRAVAMLLEKWNTKEITADKIEAFYSLLKSENGKKFDINGIFHAVVQYDKIMLCKTVEKETPVSVINEGETLECEAWKIKIKTVDKFFKKGDNNIAVFDANLLSGPFTVRSRQQGDRIALKGLGGTKKVADILSDAKIRTNERNSVPVIEKDGEILYVAGLRQSGKFAVSADTNSFLIMEYSKKELQ